MENNIDKIKEGFAFSENSLINHRSNELYLLIKMIAFNIQNWFKQAIMPEEIQHHEIKTLRGIFYKVYGNICGNGIYRHLSFALNAVLEKILIYVKEKIVVSINHFRLSIT